MLATKLFGIFLSAILAAHGFGAEPSKGKQLLRSETSPSGRMIVEYYALGQEANEIWLRPQRSTSAAAPLYKYRRDASVLFAPNESWLALTDYIGSNVSDVVLFKRTSDGRYLQASRADVSEKVIRLLRKEYPATKKLSMGTFHIQGIRWSANSKFLLLTVSALADSGERLDSWLCLYDVEKLQATSDLSSINQGVFVPKGGAN
jgi:hypothetical protein